MARSNLLVIGFVCFLEAAALRFSSLDTCSGAWSSSSRNGTVDRSFVNAAAQHIELPGNIRNLFISPENKFAFCYIEKNGCTSWTKILANINRPNEKSGLCSTDTYWAANDSQTLHGAAGQKQVFSDPAAIRAVFLRDPFARFVSAFVNKCLKLGHEGHCFDADAPSRGPVFMRDAVEWASAHDLNAGVNVHWLLQNQHCGLRQHFDAYTHVGLIQKNTYASDAMCLLEDANIERYNECDDQLVFGNKGRKENSSEKTNSDSKEVAFLKSMFTQEAANRLYTSLSPDYEFFNFPKPAWIDTATGQHYGTALPMQLFHA
eukprot:CAMPEP_0194492550 /NCGR_PEP_ID=MMETSP0253-20130528/11063_1 /TAXON_ID=2966 /ORGANISM="Noctiluca scintillans" /LENGTH=317 /DNA_ID=CAMNT_0039333427 /DNA_START=44 /DNA_END=994 /DNA_ORIENTATION=-